MTGNLDAAVLFVATHGPDPRHRRSGGEALHLLDFTPYAGAPSRTSFGADAVEADLLRLTGGQQPDGGWTVDYMVYCPAAALEWRSYTTVQAVGILRGAPL